jgi:hypothetical protein
MPESAFDFGLWKARFLEVRCDGRAGPGVMKTPASIGAKSARDVQKLRSARIEAKDVRPV